MKRDVQGLETAQFEMLRDCVGIAARNMTKDQVFEVADHLFAALKRRNEAVCWEYARKGGTEGFT